MSGRVPQLPTPYRVTSRWRHRSAPAGCRRDRHAARFPRSCAHDPPQRDRAGFARVGDLGHGRQVGAGTHDLVAADAGGHDHGHADIAVLAGEDPLEPVLLHPVQMPDEAEETGPGRHQRVRCCSPVSPRGYPDPHVAHLSEEVQQHPTLGARHIVARAVTRAARDQELSGWPATRKTPATATTPRRRPAKVP